MVDGADEYQWTYSADGSTNTAVTTDPVLGVFFTQTINGEVRVKPVNSSGEGAESVINVNVLPLPNGTLNTDDIDNTICIGESITFSGVPGQGTYSFGIDTDIANDNGSNDYQFTILQENGANHEYTVSNVTQDFAFGYAVTNDADCETFTVIRVNVVAPPSADFTGDTVVCEGSSLNLFASEQGADLYIWRKGSNIIGTTAILVINDIPTSSSGSDYSLEVIKSGCTETKNFSVQVNPGPNNTIRQECITNTGNLTIELRATEQNADTYIWRRGNTIIGNTANVTLNNPTINGLREYQLVLTKMDAQQLLKHFALSIDLPDAAGLVFGQNDVFRGQTSVNYSLNPINNATSYIWSLPPGATAQSGNVITNTPVTLVETLTPNIDLDFALDASDGILSVRGRNDCNGEGASSLFNVFMIPFPAPTNLLVTTLSGASIELVWDDNSAGSSSTEIERSLDPINFTSYASVSPGTDTFTDNNVQIGVRYYYRVRAFNGNVFSGFSNIGAAVASNVPIAPSGLTATILSPSEVRLDWIDNASNETGFRIELSSILSDNIFLEAGTPGANTEQFIITGLESNQVYFFRVRASNIEGDSPFSNIVEVEMPPSGGDNVPVPPEDVLAESVSETQIRLTWQDNINDDAIYKIERSQGDPNSFIEVDRLPAGTSNFIDKNLQPEAFYFYRIIAANSDGNAPSSDTSAAQAICNLRVLVTREDANSNTICRGKSAFLKLTTNAPGARIQWKRDGINIPGANLNTYIADREGDYTCEITTGACRKESQTGVVLIERDNFDVEIIFNTDEGILIASAINADQYQWYLDGEPIPGADQVAYKPLISGVYHVLVSLSDNICSASSDIYLFNITGIEDNDLSKKLIIYQNPVQDYLHLQLETTHLGKYQINLIDPLGKRQQISQGTKNQYLWEDKIDLIKITQGFYILEMKLEDQVMMKRLIKQ